MTCQHTMTLGVYLLGALDPAERSAFESHLSYCEICRGELVRLAPLPGLLNQITPEDFADGLPPTEVEGAGPVATRIQPITEPVPLPVPDMIPEQVPVQSPLPPETGEEFGHERMRGRPSTTRPRRYWRVATAAAAVVVLAVGAVFGWQALTNGAGTAPPPAAEGVTWTGASEDGKVRLEARLIDHEWGTEIQMKIHGTPPDRECYLVVFDHYGYKEPAGWWGTDHDPNDEIPASTSIMRSKIERLELMLDGKVHVLTIEAPS